MPNIQIQNPKSKIRYGAGGVSAIVVVVAGCGSTGLYGPAVPSTPVVGSGVACWIPCPDGVSLFVVGGSVIVGG